MVSENSDNVITHGNLGKSRTRCVGVIRWVLIIELNGGLSISSHGDDYSEASLHPHQFKIERTPGTHIMVKIRDPHMMLSVKLFQGVYIVVCFLAYMTSIPNPCFVYPRLADFAHFCDLTPNFCWSKIPTWYTRARARHAPGRRFENWTWL